MSVKNGRDYLYLVWKSDQTHTQYVVGQLSRNGSYEFSYSEGVEKAIDAGFRPLIAFPDLEKIYKSHDLFPTFSSRLPDKKRKDIIKILEKYGMNEFDAYDMLKMSGARLPIDNLQFIDPILDFDNEFERRFYIAGTRHHLGCEGKDCQMSITVAPGDEVFLEKEPDNKFDSNAIKVIDREGRLLGYVPRYYNEAFLRIIKNGRKIQCFIMSIDKRKTCSECILLSAIVSI